jgi:hypothetical protein
MKSLVDPEQADRFLELNGTEKHPQLIHPSRHFFRDGAGGPSLRMGEAKSLAYRRSRMRTSNRRS